MIESGQPPTLREGQDRMLFLLITTVIVLGVLRRAPARRGSRLRSGVATVFRFGMLLGLAVLWLWNLESDWRFAREALRWIPLPVQVVGLATFYFGSIWGLVLFLVVGPLKREWWR